jgi:DNA-binding XRE family transcriptional regulator
LINTILGSHYDTTLFWILAATQAENLDLTQQKLAEQVGYLADAIRKLEVEERRPSTKLVERLAELFAIPASERTAFFRFARGEWQAVPDEALDAMRVVTSLSVVNGRSSVGAIGSPGGSFLAGSDCPRSFFVAREWETAVAHTLWQQAMTGPGQALFISGEPGIGKTRQPQPSAAMPTG